MNKALLCLVIIGAAFAANTENDVIAAIKRIDSTQFGRTMMNTVQLQLLTSDPLDTLLQILNDIEDGLTADQKEDDATHYGFQAQCDSDLSAYAQDIADSTLLKTNLQSKLSDELYPSQTVYQGTVAQKTEEVQQYQADVIDLDNERDEEKAEFEQKVNEHTDATAVITEVKRIFSDNLQGGDSGEYNFLQRGQVTGQSFVTLETTSLMEKHLLTSAKLASKNIHRKAYAKIFKVLATIASKAHTLKHNEGLDLLLRLIDELLEKISDSLDLERNAESQRVDLYQRQRGLYIQTLRAAQTDLANTQAELASIDDQILNAETSLENVNQRLANKTQEQEDRLEQCEAAAQSYEDTRSQRSGEKSTVSDILGIINSSLRSLREELASRNVE